MKLIKRYTHRTPSFFRKLRNIGIALAATGGALLASPIALPAFLIKLAGYLAVAGTVATTVSQAVVSDNNKDADTN
jgi:ABC-type xylose transport system permease subunit